MEDKAHRSFVQTFAAMGHHDLAVRSVLVSVFVELDVHIQKVLTATWIQTKEQTDFSDGRQGFGRCFHDLK